MEKTQIMLMHGNKLRKYKPEIITLKVGETEIKSTAAIKYLGMYIDHELDWRPHIRYLMEKTNKKLPNILNVCKNTYGYGQKARYTKTQTTVGACFRYGAAFYAHHIPFCRNYIKNLHRKIVIACDRLYRTVSYLPATTITGIMLLLLQVSVAAAK